MNQEYISQGLQFLLPDCDVSGIISMISQNESAVVDKPAAYRIVYMRSILGVMLQFLETTNEKVKTNRNIRIAICKLFDTALKIYTTSFDTLCNTPSVIEMPAAEIFQMDDDI